jgi:hypothetical protein
MYGTPHEHLRSHGEYAELDHPMSKYLFIGRRLLRDRSIMRPYGKTLPLNSHWELLLVQSPTVLVSGRVLRSATIFIDRFYWDYHLGEAFSADACILHLSQTSSISESRRLLHVDYISISLPTYL